jgi:membrane associated rhomboid family serine protease
VHPSTTQIAADTQSLRRAFRSALMFVLLLWLIKLLELLGHFDFATLGILPRTATGLLGILLAPMIHGSLAHLFANSMPLVVLGTAMLYGYPRAARVALPTIYLASGLGVWLLGRAAYHIGASGLVFGLLLFVFVIGIARWDRRAIALAMVVFLLYGGMIWGIFPGRPGVSFEYHLAGAVSGVLLAILLRNVDPRPPERRYSWELEEEDDRSLGEYDRK